MGKQVFVKDERMEGDEKDERLYFLFYYKRNDSIDEGI